MTEAAIFTAVPVGRLVGPDGLPERRLAVTVVVTPRLEAPAGTRAPLDDFPTFAGWADAVAATPRWALEVDGLGTVEARPLDVPVVPDPELWRTLFGRTEVGTSALQRFDQAVVHSFPVAGVTAAVRGLYRTVATASPLQHPPITRGPLAGALAELLLPGDPRQEREGGRRAVRRRLLAELRGATGGPGARAVDFDAPVAATPAVALAAAQAFYDRTDDPWDEAAATAGPPEPAPPEFHSFVARCADFPALLRHLGLAVDLWIDDDDAIPEHGRLAVAPGAGDGPLDHLLAPLGARPWTLVRRTDRIWAPSSRERAGDIEDGSLLVEGDRFVVDAVDPDGAALKVTGLLENLARTAAELERSAAANGGAPSTVPDAATLPALRSTGIVVARRNRGPHLVAQLDASRRHEDDRLAGRRATLEAADVTRGWRLDVLDHDAGGPWRSLHRRIGEYRLVAPDGDPVPLAVQPGPDEAYVKAASTTSPGSAPSDDQYLHETLLGWDGWSLATKRPGRAQGELDTVPAAAPEEVAATGFGLAAGFRAEPGSLPRLRYGRRYRLRVRAVDLAGSSVPADQLDEAHERDLDGPYRRWEPVPSPAVVPLTRFTEGESLLRLVLRSTLGTDVATYVALDRVRDLPGHRLVEEDGREGVAYRTTNARHLAAPLGPVQLAETHGVLDAAMSGDPAAASAQLAALAARESGSFLTAPGARLISRHPVPTVLDGTRGQPLAEGEYVVHAAPLVELPYLPDPLARGVSLTTLPGDGPGTTRLLTWPGDAADWSDRRPVRLEVVDGAAPPAWDPDARVLTVALPPATLVTVRLASFVDERDVDLLAVWGLMEEGGAGTAERRADVREGRAWMTTPWTDLTLVHAVERPLAPPVLELGGGPFRTAGTTFSLLPGVVRNHAASTGRIDIDAHWDEPVDDVLAAAPGQESRRAHVTDFSLTPSEDAAQLWPTNGPAAGPFGQRHEARHELGDTKHRWVTYTATATTRFREYFPVEITSRPELVTHVGPPVTVDVPSSRRPDPPDVRQVLPTWRWREDPLDVPGSPLAVRRVRTGGGLRVYLGRPWFSSGADELLGVVLAVQPWLTWPVDVAHGVGGADDLRLEADRWAAAVLGRAAAADPSGAAAELGDGLAVAVADAVPQVARGVGALSGLRVAVEGGHVHVTPGTAIGPDGQPIEVPATEPPDDGDLGPEHRFLQAAQTAMVAARAVDPAIAAAVRATATDALVDPGQVVGRAAVEILGRGTSPEGRRFCSSWGADPVVAGDPVPPGPAVHTFASRTAVGRAALAEVPGTRVTVVGHQPEYDAARRLWFCDLELDAGTAYTPFVQLALVRYQPHSVPGTEISTVVLADFVPLLPEREATVVVVPDGSAVTVTLAGTVGVPAHARAEAGLAREVTASRVVEAWLERLPEGAGDLGWEVVGAAVRLDVRLGLAAARGERFADVAWVGGLALPTRSPGERWRVRLTEHELHEADPLGAPRLAVRLPLRDRRLVYADEVELP